MARQRPRTAATSGGGWTRSSTGGSPPWSRRAHRWRRSVPGTSGCPGGPASSCRSTYRHTSCRPPTARRPSRSPEDPATRPRSTSAGCGRPASTCTGRCRTRCWPARARPAGRLPCHACRTGGSWCGRCSRPGRARSSYAVGCSTRAPVRSRRWRSTPGRRIPHPPARRRSTRSTGRWGVRCCGPRRTKQAPGGSGSTTRWTTSPTPPADLPVTRPSTPSPGGGATSTRTRSPGPPVRGGWTPR